MSRLLEIMRKLVRQELSRTRSSLLGVVTAVYPHTDSTDENNYDVDLVLKHEGLQLSKVPIAITHVGLAATPRAGDLLLVQFLDGDLNQPVVTGRFYHAGERPPLHDEDEVLFEQRVASDSTINQLRFCKDGSIFLQRDVQKPEDNSKAKAGIRIDGASGDVEIKAGDKIVVLLGNDGKIEITADGKPLHITCDKLTVDGAADINGDVKVTGDMTVKGSAGSTTISGNEISGS